MTVTAEQVKQAVMDAEIAYIPHHECGFCKCEVYYSVIDGNLFFNPSCGCASEPPRPCDWQEAADWINMQSNDNLLERFGLCHTE